MMTGSLGMLPSASLGAQDDAPAGAARCTSRCMASAPGHRRPGPRQPDRDAVSFAMMLRYSFDLDEDADMIERAVQNVLNGGTAHRGHHGRPAWPAARPPSWVTRSSANWRRWRRKHQCRNRQKSPPDLIRRAFLFQSDQRAETTSLRLRPSTPLRTASLLGRRRRAGAYELRRVVQRVQRHQILLPDSTSGLLAAPFCAPLRRPDRLASLFGSSVSAPSTRRVPVRSIDSRVAVADRPRISGLRSNSVRRSICAMLEAVSAADDSTPGSG